MLVASPDAVRSHLRNDPQGWEHLAIELAYQVRSLQDRIEGLCLRDAEQRIAQLLLKWVETARDRGADEPFEVSLTHRDLGGLIGATRETMRSRSSRESVDRSRRFA